MNAVNITENNFTFRDHNKKRIFPTILKIRFILSAMVYPIRILGNCIKVGVHSEFPRG